MYVLGSVFEPGLKNNMCLILRQLRGIIYFLYNKLSIKEVLFLDFLINTIKAPFLFDQ